MTSVILADAGAARLAIRAWAPGLAEHGRGLKIISAVVDTCDRLRRNVKDGRRYLRASS